jgi:hypothetical protein
MKTKLGSKMRRPWLRLVLGMGILAGGGLGALAAAERTARDGGKEKGGAPRPPPTRTSCRRRRGPA